MTGKEISQRRVLEVMVSIITIISIVLSLGTLTRAEIEQPEVRLPALEEVNAASYCVYDKTAGEIILSKNPDETLDNISANINVSSAK